jgi:hypothetical protein
MSLLPRATLHSDSEQSDPAEQSSAGYQTPGNNFKYEYFREFETGFKSILGCEFGDYMGYIRGKK